MDPLTSFTLCLKTVSLQTAIFTHSYNSNVFISGTSVEDGN